MNRKSNEELDVYAGGEINEIKDTPIPWYIKWLSLILPLWGVIWFFYFNDGSTGWVDRGAWDDLQKAAQTKNSQLKINKPNK